MPGERAEHGGRKPGADSESGLLGGRGGVPIQLDKEGIPRDAERDPLEMILFSDGIENDDWGIVMFLDKHMALFKVPVFSETSPCILNQRDPWDLKKS